MVDSGWKITVGLWTLADHNLPMSDEIPTVRLDKMSGKLFFLLLSANTNVLR